MLWGAVVKPRTLLLPALVGVIAACASGVPEAASEAALASADAVDALHYDVTLTVDDVAGSFLAEVVGTYATSGPTAELALDFEGNEVDAAFVEAKATTFRREGARLLVALPPGTGSPFDVRVRVHGAVGIAERMNADDLGNFGGLMLRQKNLEGGRIYTTMSWPQKTRRWLPLRDHPRDGATVAMHATFPARYRVLSNGVGKDPVVNDDGTRTWHYEADTPMPPYAIHVSAYDRWNVGNARSSSGVPITTYTYPKHASTVRSVYGDAPAALDFYERTYGPYRWKTLAYAEEPIFGGGMEHATVVSMDDGLVDDPAWARKTVWHEMAHHWSGDLVRLATWNDFWLSEGLAEYLTARAYGAIDGPDAMREQFRGYLVDALEDEKANPHPIAPQGGEVDVKSIYDAVSYHKGALVLRQLEHMVGEEAMTSFLRGWFDRHAFQAVTTKDLETELSAATGRDLAGFFRSFVYGSGHPHVTVTFEPKSAGTQLTIRQDPADGARGAFTFPLDLELSKEDERHRVTVEVSEKLTTKIVNPGFVPTRVVVDPDEVLVGTVGCGAAKSATCRDEFRCRSSRCVAN